MTLPIPAGTAEPDGKCSYFACSSCCSINHIRTEQWKQLMDFFCFGSPHPTVTAAVGQSRAVFTKGTKVQLRLKTIFPPVKLIQNHLNGFEEQLNMSGSDLKEQFNLVWATRVIRFYYTVQTHERCWPFKTTCCPVKPGRGPAQHRIALNGISQH